MLVIAQSPRIIILHNKIGIRKKGAKKMSLDYTREDRISALV